MEAAHIVKLERRFELLLPAAALSMVLRQARRHDSPSCCPSPLSLNSFISLLALVRGRAPLIASISLLPQSTLPWFLSLLAAPGGRPAEGMTAGRCGCHSGAAHADAPERGAPRTRATARGAMRRPVRGPWEPRWLAMVVACTVS